MVLNATNRDFLFDNLKVEDTDQMTGAKVRIMVEPVRFKGELMNGMRIKAARPMQTYQAPIAPQVPRETSNSAYTSDLGHGPQPTMPPAGAVKDFDDEIPF
jgi:hypothetical protein